MTWMKLRNVEKNNGYLVWFINDEPIDCKNEIRFSVFNTASGYTQCGSVWMNFDGIDGSGDWTDALADMIFDRVRCVTVTTGGRNVVLTNEMVEMFMLALLGPWQRCYRQHWLRMECETWTCFLASSMKPKKHASG